MTAWGPPDGNYTGEPVAWGGVEFSDQCEGLTSTSSLSERHPGRSHWPDGEAVACGSASFCAGHSRLMSDRMPQFGLAHPVSTSHRTTHGHWYTDSSTLLHQRPRCVPRQLKLPAHCLNKSVAARGIHHAQGSHYCPRQSIHYGDFCLSRPSRTDGSRNQANDSRAFFSRPQGRTGPQGRPRACWSSRGNRASREEWPPRSKGRTRSSRPPRADRSYRRAWPNWASGSHRPQW